MSSGKWRPFLLGLNVLIHLSRQDVSVYAADELSIYTAKYIKAADLYNIQATDII